MSKIGYFVAAVLAVSAMGAGWSAWRSMGNVPMGMSGTLAMILAAIGALALGGGLLALLFISQRKGFDEGAGGHSEPRQGGRSPDQQ